MNFAQWQVQLNTTGWIAPVQLGMSRDELVQLFGAPTDSGRGFREAKLPMILVYGEIEFHFGPTADDGLQGIYSDSDGVVRLCVWRRSTV
jgi:hypothetical protein